MSCHKIKIIVMFNKISLRADDHSPRIFTAFYRFSFFTSSFFLDAQDFCLNCFVVVVLNGGLNLKSLAYRVYFTSLYRF